MKGFLKFLFWVALFAGILFLIGWAFLFEVHTSDDNAMAPNIIRGDSYLVYVHSALDPGTPAVCAHPTNEGEKVVGRIVGVAGDKIGFSRGDLSFNGDSVEHTVEGEYVLVDETNTGRPHTVQLEERIETLGMIRYRVLFPGNAPRRSRRLTTRERTIREGKAFLAADNRVFGEDSRVYGEVEISSCIGRPLLVYNPAESSGDAGSTARLFAFIR